MGLQSTVKLKSGHSVRTAYSATLLLRYRSNGCDFGGEAKAHDGFYDRIKVSVFGLGFLDTLDTGKIVLYGAAETACSISDWTATRVARPIRSRSTQTR